MAATQRVRVRAFAPWEAAPGAEQQQQQEGLKRKVLVCSAASSRATCFHADATCRGLRGVTETARVPVDAAVKLGLTPCRSCRPLVPAPGRAAVVGAVAVQDAARRRLVDPVVITSSGKGVRFHAIEAACFGLRGAGTLKTYERKLAIEDGYQPCAVCVRRTRAPPQPPPADAVAVLSGQPQDVPATAARGQTFYSTPSGQCYHIIKNCGKGGLKSASKVLEYSERPQKRRPCQHCCK